MRTRAQLDADLTARIEEMRWLRDRLGEVCNDLVRTAEDCQVVAPCSAWRHLRPFIAHMAEFRDQLDRDADAFGQLLPVLEAILEGGPVAVPQRSSPVRPPFPAAEDPGPPPAWVSDDSDMI